MIKIMIHEIPSIAHTVTPPYFRKSNLVPELDPFNRCIANPVHLLNHLIKHINKVSKKSSFIKWTYKVIQKNHRWSGKVLLP
jgi:hypothetical protein